MTTLSAEPAKPVAVASRRVAALPVIGTLCARELVRFFRQRNRVMGAIGQPILFWILFGAGLRSSFRLPGTAGELSYQEYFFPGTLALIVLFTAIFATISIIEDRREGFLQSVLVAPIPRWAMVLGKLSGGTAIAVLQALVFLLLGLALIDMSPGLIGFVGIVTTLIVMSLALTGLGFVIAWRMDSVQGFHAVMSLFLMPLWLLSGAFFPASSGWLSWIVWVNPLTYAVATLRHFMYWTAAPELQAQVLPEGLPSLSVSISITVLFAAAMFVAACWISAQRSRGDML